MRSRPRCIRSAWSSQSKIPQPALVVGRDQRDADGRFQTREGEGELRNARGAGSSWRRSPWLHSFCHNPVMTGRWARLRTAALRLLLEIPAHWRRGGFGGRMGNGEELRHARPALCRSRDCGRAGDAAVRGAGASRTTAPSAQRAAGAGCDHGWVGLGCGEGAARSRGAARDGSGNSGDAARAGAAGGCHGAGRAWLGRRGGEQRGH